MDRYKHKLDHTTFFSWEIQNFRQNARRSLRFIKSEEFFLDTSAFSCSLVFEPKSRDPGVNSDYSSLSLKLCGFGASDSVKLRFSMWMENKNGAKQQVVTAEHLYEENDESSHVYTFPNYIHQNVLYGPNRHDFLIDDTLCICCKVTKGDLLSVDDVPSSKRLREGLANLRNDPIFSDFTIKVGNKEFKVIKALLAAQSDVFKSMFSLDTIEKRENKLEIKDSNSDAIEAFIDFLYTGEISESSPLIYDLFILADKYQIEVLKSECSTRLCEKISDDNVINLLSLAFMRNDLNMKRALLEHVTNKVNKSYFSSLLICDEWENFSRENGPIAKDIKKAILEKVASMLE